MKGNSQTFGVVITPLTDDINKSILSEYFSRFGKIANISINQKRNCSYINYEKKDSANRASQEMDGQHIGNTKIKAEAQNKSNPKSNLPCVYITGFDQNTTEAYLSKAFQTLPGFKNVSIPKGKKFGFINFNTEDEAELALNEINGRRIGNFTIQASYRQSAHSAPSPPIRPPQREKVPLPIQREKVPKPIQRGKVSQPTQRKEEMSQPKVDDSTSPHAASDDLSIDRMIVSFIESFLKTKYYASFDQFSSFYSEHPMFTLSQSFLRNWTDGDLEENEKQTAHSPFEITQILKNSVFGSLACGFESLLVSQIGEYAFSVMLNGHFKDVESMEVFRVLTIFYSFEESQFKISADHIHVKVFVPKAI